MERDEKSRRGGEGKYDQEEGRGKGKTRQDKK